MNSIFSQGSKVVAAAGTPERLTTTSTLARRVYFQGRKAQGTANTGAVYLGDRGTLLRILDATGAGRDWTLESVDPDKPFDLADIWVDAATTADGVMWTAVR